MKNLFKALASFQQEVPIIHKGTEGYGYSYADLPAILPIINPLLAKHGLGFTQLGTGTGIKTIIFHSESGETLESLFDIPQGVSLAKMNDFQVLGSAITYMRRYALSSALGLVTDKDTDAGGEQGKKQAQTDDAPKRWECKQTGLLQPNGANYFNPTNKDGSVNNGGAKLIERLASEEAQDILDSMHEKGFKMSKDSWEWFIKQIK